MLRFKDNHGLDFPNLKKTTLGEVCNKIGDGLHSAPIYDVNGEYYFINGNNLKDGVIIITPDTKKVSKKTFLKNDKKLDDRTILLSINGTIGNLAYYKNENVMLGKSAAYLKIKESVDKKYIYQLLQTRKVKISFLLSLTGTTIKNLGLESINKTHIFIPVLDEQHKIADFLSSVDDVIQIQEEKITALEEQKKGIMQKLFNREVRFKADDGSEYPEWERKNIGSACVVNPKTEKLENEFYYIDLGSVDKGNLVLDSTILKDDAPSRAQRVLSLDDVIFQSVRPYNMGHYHYTYLMDKQVVASTGFIQLRLKDGLNAYLYQLLYTSHFNNEVDIRCTGSNYPAINSDSLAEIGIDLPCNEEQKKIVDCLSAYDEAIQIKKEKLEIWKEIKRGLLQQMFA